MPTVILPFELANDETADADEVMADLNTILAALNGGLEYDNLDAAAAIRLTQLARGALGPAMGAFAAGHGSSTTYTGLTSTLLKFDTEVFDISGWFDPTSTNYRFTPQQAGVYRLHAQCKIETATDQAYYSLKIRKNGGIFREGVLRAAGASDFVEVDALVEANGTTDYFDVVLENQGASSQISSGAFEGHLIGLV